MKLWLAMFFAMAASATAEPLKKDGVSLELVAEKASVEPGKPIRLGLIIRHEPGFHTYWRQPGIVGLAPTLAWTLPDRFSAGAILWPEPERTTMAKWGVWGYERDVCLVTEIAPPADLDIHQTASLTFTVKAIWMACGRTCHPGHAELNITLPIQRETAAATRWAPMIAKTLAEQPRELPDWSVNASRTETGFTLTVVPPAGATVPDDAYFFSYGRLVDSDAAQKLVRQADGTAVLTTGLVEFADPLPKTLEGELWSATGWRSGGTPAVRLWKVNPVLQAPRPTK